MDPAVVDRRTTQLAGIDDAHLPVRAMSIAGLEGRLAARILSKDMSGPATRLAQFEDGWGSGAFGAFTADVSLFVVKGRVTIGEEVLGRYDLARMPRRSLLPGIRAEDGAVGLLFTSAPVAYDTTSGGIAAAVEIVRSDDVGWEPLPGQTGRVVKRLASSDDDTWWLSGSVEWSGDGGRWHRHPVAEEAFVLEGAISISELGPGGPETHHYLPGGYLWRLPGTLHGGPGSGAADMAIVFHHAPGKLTTEWVEATEVPVPRGSIAEG